MRYRAGVRTAAFAAVVSVLGASCGGDDGASPATTDAPAVETAATEAPVTAPAPTEPAPTEPAVTEPAPTDPPSTEPAAVPTFTSAELAAALPSIDVVDPPWTAADVEPILDPAPNSGPGIGSCGGPNGAARAAEAGIVGSVLGIPFRQGNNRHRVNPVVYSFVSEEAASAFIASSLAANQCTEPVTWSLVEGSGEGQYDGFADGVAEGTVWDHSGVYSGELIEMEGVDEALLTTSEVTRRTTFADITFGETDIDQTVYTRNGPIVVVTILAGRVDQVGYLNLDQLEEYDATPEEAVDLASALSTAVFENLGVA